MLGRLLKYEMKSTSRFMLFIYAAVLALGLILGLVIRLEVYFDHTEMQWGGIMSTSGSGLDLASILLVVLIVVYVLLLTIMGVLTIIMIVMRFYNNLLQGEGYLMHTLPVPTWMLVTSKLLIAVVWQIIALAVSIASIVLIGVSSGMAGYIIRENGLAVLREALEELSGVNLASILFAALAGTLITITHFYFSMAIGNLANKNKILWAVIAYVVTNIIISVVSTVLGIGTRMFDVSSFAGFMWRAGALSMAGAAVCFAGTIYILKNKLNLA